MNKPEKALVSARLHDGDSIDGSGAASEASDETGFSQDLQRFWLEVQLTRAWLIALLVGSFLLALLATLLMTPLYEARARIEVSQIVANVTDLDPLDGGSTVSELQYLNTQYELIESRFMARRVAEAGNLRRDERFLNAFQLSESEFVTERKIEDILSESVTVKGIKQSSLIDIVFTSPSPEVSAQLANLWANEFISANYDKRFGDNIDARDFLQAQLGELRDTLARSEQDLVEYANANEILVLDPGNGDGPERTAAQTLAATDLEALNTALAQAITDRISAQAAVQSGDLAGRTRNTQLGVALTKAEAELSTIAERFGPAYDPLRQKEAEVEALRAALAEEEGILRSELQNSLASSTVRERELRAELEKSKSRFQGQQDQSIQYGILKREVETNREIYDALLQRFKELEASGAGQNNIKLIDAAQPPLVPASPSLVQNLLIGIVLGTSLCGGLVYLRVLLSQSLRSSEDVKQRIGLSVLGAIPKIETADLVSEAAVSSSEMGEAYRSLRSNLAFLTSQGEPQVLLLTSTVPAEGKSLSCVALASSFAKFGRKTLLVDADLRNSRLASTLMIEAGERRGLSGLLTMPDVSLAEEAISIVNHGFDYVPIGRKPPIPVDLLATPRFKELIDDAREHYDQVIIDGAPMLSLADAVETARAADGILYIIEYNRVKAKAITASIDRLEATGARVFGAILTKLDGHASDYGYGYGYGYGQEQPAALS